MADLPKYHIGEQDAYSLLQPIQAVLRDLEARTRHYASRLRLADEADRAALDQASEALAAARRTLEQLVAEQAASANV